MGLIKILKSIVREKYSKKQRKEKEHFACPPLEVATIKTLYSEIGT